MSHPVPSISNLVELLRYRAVTKPDFEAYSWLSDEGPTRTLSYAELDLAACRIAARLRSAGAARKPVVLVYPAGLEFIAAFFGCLYAGAIAVPVYPPGARRGLDRLAAIIGDCGAQFGLTTPALAKRLGKMEGLSALHWLTDGGNQEASGEWEIAQVLPETLALLQYTSGSTGNPKGVMVSHGNIMANERAIKQSFRQDESSVIVSWLPMAHDMGLIGGVLQPLYVGARSLLFSPAAFVQDPARWLRTISRYRATTSGGPDFAYRLCSRKLGLEEKVGLDLSCWRVAFNGAEPVRRETLEEFSEKFQDCGFRREAFHPCYGLAESTLLVACNNHGQAQNDLTSKFTSCGPVIEQHSVRIVEPETGQPCDDGVTGEIWVSGPSVARGYWNRPLESEAVFRSRLADIDDHFLRTGDLGFLNQGDLVVAGRLKDLIIIRGQNYYPEDIEISIECNCLNVEPNSCVVFALEGAVDQRIVAVQEVSAELSNLETTLSTIRQTVSTKHELRLDEIVLVPQGAIPKTSSGKVRRRRCQALLESGDIEVIARWRSQPNQEDLGTHTAWLPDFDSSESVSNWIKKQVAVLTGLELQSIELDREIISYGVDSVAVAELAGRLAGHGVELDVTVLSQRTIRNLAELISNSPRTHRIEQSDISSLREFPLSRGQYGLWLNQQMETTSSIYNLAAAARIKSALNPLEMRRACDAVVARHPILRATFPIVDGQPVQRISELTAEVFEHIDTEGLESAEVEHHVAMTAYQPFDLATGPLVRVILYQGGSSSSVLLVVAHHIVSDFSSLVLLVEELFACYAPEPAGLRLSSLPFSEYIRREERVLSNDAENRLWEFWRRELTPLPPPLELPFKHGLEAESTHQAGWETAHFDLAAVATLRSLSALRHTTLYTTLGAAFQLLLHRYSGQSDFAIGSPISLRDAEFRYTQGYFINPIILRANFAGDPTFIEFLDQTRQVMLRALEHRHFPFGSLVSRLKPVRTTGRLPLVQALFTFLSRTGSVADSAAFALGVPGARFSMGSFELESLELRPASVEFDLTFMVAEATNGLYVALGYNQGLFEAETATAMLRSWKLLLEGIAANPSDRISTLPILSAAEIQFLLFDFNDTSAGFENICIHEAFERSALEMPNAIAVSGEGKSLTYVDLNDRANRLAGYLRSNGVRPDDTVGVCLRRSPDLLVVLLSILKSGGAYLPLDPNYPADRIAFMLADSGAKVVVAHEELAAVLQDYRGKIVHFDREWPQISTSAAHKAEAVCDPDNLAYVMYTSGSTGRPKGVMIAHRNVANFFAGMDRLISAGKGDAWLAVTSICFDISVLELLWTVTRGIHVLLDTGLGGATAANLGEAAFSLFDPASEVANVRPTHLQCTPSLARMLFGREDLLSGLDCMLVGGEALPVADAGRLVRSLSGKVYNMYGPTETCVWSTSDLLNRERDDVSLGSPLANTRVYITGRYGELTPVGIPGEICIGGEGVARGYLDRPDITAGRFVPDPFSTVPGARMYRTGDRGAFSCERRLQFLGRFDDQVKLRGYRIELGEIEGVLSHHPDVHEAAATVQSSAELDPQLFCYVVARNSHRPPADELRRFLGKKLPEYMLPSSFIWLEKMPRTPNGKLDRTELASTVGTWACSSESLKQPQDIVEEVLAGIWVELLQIDSVGVDRSFFDVGGHSLLAMRLLGMVREIFHVRVDLGAFFKNPTIAALAHSIRMLAGDRAHRSAELFRTVEQLPEAQIDQMLRELDQYSPQ